MSNENQSAAVLLEENIRFLRLNEFGSNAGTVLVSENHTKVVFTKVFVLVRVIWVEKEVGGVNHPS